LQFNDKITGGLTGNYYYLIRNLRLSLQQAAFCWGYKVQTPWAKVQ